MPQFKVSRAFANNAPDYFIVHTGKWGEPELARCDSEAKAQQVARALNDRAVLVDGLRDIATGSYMEASDCEGVASDTLQEVGEAV